MIWFQTILALFVVLGALLHWLWFEPMAYRSPIWARLAAAIAAVAGVWHLLEFIWKARYGG